MGLLKSGRPTPPVDDVTRGRGDSWPAMLRRWLVECPRCAQVWLAVGARENDRHVCKGCGHAFIIRTPSAPEDVPFKSDVAAREHR